MTIRIGLLAAAIAALLLFVGCGGGSSSSTGKNAKKSSTSSTTTTASPQDVKNFCTARNGIFTTIAEVAKLNSNSASKGKVKSDFNSIKSDLQKMKSAGPVLSTSAQQSLVKATTTFLSSVQKTVKSASGDPKKLLAGLQSNFATLKSSLTQVTSGVSC